MLQKKIDRGTIERLRAFQNPPPMVGMTMVMLMVLIGRPEFSHIVTTQAKADRKYESYSYSDEASRISSATSKRRREQTNKFLYQQMGNGFIFVTAFLLLFLFLFVVMEICFT